MMGPIGILDDDLKGPTATALINHARDLRDGRAGSPKLELVAQLQLGIFGPMPKTWVWILD